MYQHDETAVKADNRHWYFASPFFEAIYMVACIGIGLSYTAIQWRLHRKVADALFVGLLLGATFLLLRGMRAIYNYFRINVLSFFAFALEKKDYHRIPALSEEYCNAVFLRKHLIIAGVLYGLAISLAVIPMNVWKGELLLKGLLILFLYVINFVTGVGFYGALKFFICSWKLGAYVKVDLWQRENPTTLFFMKIKRKMAILATIYITMSVTSIFLSELRMRSLSLGYSVFAGAIVIVIFILPEIPIRKKLVLAKKKALLTVNIQLQSEFQKTISEEKNDSNQVELGRIEKLILLKEKIEKVSVWPFGMQTVNTVFSVILITVLPMIMELLLKYLLG